MANISESSGTFSWSVPNRNEPDFRNDNNFVTIKKIISALGIMSNDDYGISSDTWTDINDFIKTNPTELVSLYGEGRWGFGSSLEENNFSELIEFLNNSESKDVPININIINFLKYNPISEKINIKKQPSRKSPNQYNLIALPILILLKRQLINALTALKNRFQLTDEFQIFEVSFNDFEPGDDYLEINASFQLTFNFYDNNFELTYINGETIYSPSTDTLYDYGFAENTSAELIDQLFTNFDLITPLENFIKKNSFAKSLINYQSDITEKAEIYSYLVEEPSDCEADTTELIITLIDMIREIMPHDIDISLISDDIDSLSESSDYEQIIERLINFLKLHS